MNEEDRIKDLETRLHQSEASREEMRAALQANGIFHTPIALRKNGGEWDEYQLDAISRTKKALSSTSGTGWLSPEEAAKLRDRIDAADKMRGEALLALGTMQNERDSYAAHIARESRISDSEMMALLRRRAMLVDEQDKELTTLRARVAKLEGALRLWEEYHDLLNTSNEIPIRIAHAHGWKCSEEDVQKGKEYRQKIAALTPPPPSQARENIWPTDEECEWVVKKLSARNPRLFEPGELSREQLCKALISVWIAQRGVCCEPPSQQEERPKELVVYEKTVNLDEAERAIFGPPTTKEEGSR